MKESELDEVTEENEEPLVLFTEDENGNIDMSALSEELGGVGALYCCVEDES